MDQRRESLRREAEDLFLAREPVIGVGIQSLDSAPIVFLLREHNPSLEAEITAWASGHSLNPAFQVVGSIEV
jgi:hypothetical protein